MQNSSIKFNIIVPTRERADVLYHCLRTLVPQDYENLNLIVSDNFSQDNTREVVASFKDARIKYVNPGKRLSMSHHWEFALSHVTEGWVVIVGDDDGLLPGTLNRFAQVIKDTGTSAVISQVCIFEWPGTVAWEDNLRVPLGKGFEWRDSGTWIKKVMRGDATYMDLPCLYTGGAAELSVINRVKKSNGDFYGSWVPDIYSAFALASVVDRYVMIREPLAIAGRSAHSNGASGWGYIKDKGPAQKFQGENNIPFHHRLINKGWPHEWAKSIPISVYECYLQSAHLHHDFLKIKIEDQLGLALAGSLPGDHAAVLGYCREIVQRNDLNMSVVLTQEKYFKKRRFFKNLKEKVEYALFNLALSGKEFGVRDVYDACLVAHAVTHFDTQWRFKKILRGLKKCIGISKI